MTNQTISGTQDLSTMKNEPPIEESNMYSPYYIPNTHHHRWPNLITIFFFKRKPNSNPILTKTPKDE